jgi:hypothetical protein
MFKRFCVIISFMCATHANNTRGSPPAMRLLVGLLALMMPMASLAFFPDLSGVPSNVTVLELRDEGISEVPAGAFARFAALETLYVARLPWRLCLDRSSCSCSMHHAPQGPVWERHHDTGRRRFLRPVEPHHSVRGIV